MSISTDGRLKAAVVAVASVAGAAAAPALAAFVVARGPTDASVDAQAGTATVLTTGADAPPVLGPPAPPPTSPSTSPASSDQTPRPFDRGTPPAGLAVPRLGIDVPVVPVRAPEGELVPPDDPTVIGWWATGARPAADVGTSILTGHTVHSGGGAFDDLETLRPGDPVLVRTAESLERYVVASVTYYPRDRLAREAPVVFDQAGPHRLALVTCEEWDGSDYRGNTVVLAEPVIEPVSEPVSEPISESVSEPASAAQPRRQPAE